MAILSLFLQGCGGGTSGVSTVSGSVADINRNTITGATVTVDDFQTQSLASGTFRINGVQSGWKTFRASVMVDGQRWVGSQAVEVLKNEPTMNANIVLAPISQTTTISGIVRDDTAHRVSGARVLLTTRIVFDGTTDKTSAYDGPYSSMVAITDRDGHYVLEDVPVGVTATLAASKVGFHNSEINDFQTTSSGDIQDFDLVTSNLANSPDAPTLEAIESYTMPASLTRSSDTNAYKAIKAFTSARYLKSLGHQKATLTRAAPSGSLIEVDLYWNGLSANDSRNIAGYGIYRTPDIHLEPKSIDFVRDPYANFYGDTGAEITPYTDYYYAVSAVDVQFLDSHNNPDPASESPTSEYLADAPLGQLSVTLPDQGDTLSGNPTFTWQSLRDAESYTVYVYDQYPTLPLDPSYNYGSDPIVGQGAMPIWPRQSAPNDSTVGAGQTSIAYGGPALTHGHTYYWVVLASKVYESDTQGYPIRSAYSYSQIRSFTR